MFKQSRVWSYQLIQASKKQDFDLGFLEVTKYLPRANVPHKASKLHPLTKTQKQENKQLAQSRIVIEHINRELKIFKICRYTRRHKQKKHKLFWSIVAGIVNLKRSERKQRQEIAEGN